MRSSNDSVNGSRISRRAGAFGGDKAYEGFAGHPIRDFVPVFVERVARDELSRGT